MNSIEYDDDQLSKSDLEIIDKVFECFEEPIQYSANYEDWMNPELEGSFDEIIGVFAMISRWEA